MTAEYPMHVLSFDFRSDVTSCGRHIRFFNVIDEYTRTALAIIPRRYFKATDVIAVLEDIIAETGIQPGFVRCDNGSQTLHHYLRLDRWPSGADAGLFGRKLG